MIELHQVAVGAGHGDAITSMMTETQGWLRTVGSSEIFAYHTDARVAHVRPLHEFPAGRSRDRLIIYHASMGEPAMTRFLLSRREPIVLVYHNITPSEFFVDSSVEIAALAEWGRRELALIADRCVLAVADSAFNAEDLLGYGYPDVAVAPVGVDPDRLLGYRPDADYAGLLDQRVGRPYVLSVSQLFPHKRHELVVHAVHLLQTVHHLDVGLAIVGAPRAESYRRALAAMIDELALSNVLLAGGISNCALATAYAGASVFVTASEHEGLALPPLEAMAFGVPVVARGFGALPDTIGRGGLVIQPGSGPREIAETMAEILTNDRLRDTLRRRGTHRVRDWRPERSMAVFLELLAGVL